MKFEMLQCRNSNVLLKQQSFNTGDYVNAILSKQRAETISNVLYPDDRTYQGKELRLKQQYFFVSASLQDIIRRFKDHHSTFDDFADKVAVQLNDTHPTIGVPELMRLLVDVEGLQWAKAWDITTKVFSITIHSVVAETLEKWSVELLQTLLPRHLQIIFKINAMFLEEVKNKIGNDYDHLARLSIIEEGEKKVSTLL
jgi:starch phosphorylase